MLDPVQQSIFLRPGTKGFPFRKWFIGYNFGADYGPESRFGTHKELIVLKCLKYKYCKQPEYNTINWRGTTHFDSEDDYRTGCQNVSRCPIQDYVHPDDHTQPTFTNIVLIAHVICHLTILMRNKLVTFSSFGMIVHCTSIKKILRVSIILNAQI